MATFRIHCISTGESRKFRAVSGNTITTTDVKRMYVHTLVAKGYKLADIKDHSLEQLYHMKQRDNRWKALGIMP